MKLKHPIHPEIIAGTRGNSDVINQYRTIFSEIRFTKEDAFVHVKRGGVIENNLFFRRALGLEGDEYTDWSLMRFQAMIQDWRSKTYKSYYIGTDFAKTLSEVNLRIPMKILPDTFFGYVAFPQNTISDEEEFLSGCYVRIGYCRELALNIKGACDTDRFIWICATSQNTIGKHSDMLCKLPDGDVKLEDILFNTERGEWSDYARSVDTVKGLKTPLSDETQRKREIGFRTALNAVIYTRSEGAELLSCASERNLTKSKKIEARAAGRLTDCTVPLVLIHPNYHKPREMHADETWVRSHPRWQPCGPDLSNVKLIWVREHKRIYKKEDYVRPEIHSSSERPGTGIGTDTRSRAL